jgi:hypothetical protein
MNKFKFIYDTCIKSQEDICCLIKVLLHIGQDEAAYLLNKYALIGSNLIHLIDLSIYDPKFGPVPDMRINRDDPNEPLENLVPPPVQQENLTTSGPYSMTKQIRGYCVLINNYFTFGTYKEMQRFRNIFYQMHFEVIMKKNLDKQDLLRTLRIISQDPKLETHDAFMLMIIAHGNNNKEVYGFDGQSVRINTIMEMFNNEECRFLQNKPKCFFFNCCRGGYKF